MFPAWIKSWKFLALAYLLLRFCFGGAYIFFYENVKNKEGDTFAYWETAKQIKHTYYHNKEALHFILKDLWSGDKWIYSGRSLREFKKPEEPDWKNAEKRKEKYYKTRLALRSYLKNICFGNPVIYDELLLTDLRKIEGYRELVEPYWLEELLNKKQVQYAAIYNPSVFRNSLLFVPVAFLGIENYYFATFILIFISSLWMLFLLKKLIPPGNLWLWIPFVEPNIMFWSVGISKELFLFPAFWTLILMLFIKPPSKFAEFLSVLFSLLLLFGIKPYLLIILPFAVLYHIFSVKNRLIRYSLLLLGAFFFWKQTWIYPIGVLEEIRFTYLYSELQGGTLLPSLGEYEISFTELLQILPKAFYNSFLAPAFYDFGSKRLFSIYQSVFIFFLLVFFIRHFREKIPKISRRNVFLLASSLVLGLIIGFSTPNLGTIVRYRIFHFSLFLYVFFSCVLKNRF